MMYGGMRDGMTHGGATQTLPFTEALQKRNESGKLMTTQVARSEYKSIQEKEKVCAEMTGNQFPYQKQVEIKYPQLRNEQENPNASRGS